MFGSFDDAKDTIKVENQKIAAAEIERQNKKQEEEKNKKEKKEKK